MRGKPAGNSSPCHHPPRRRAGGRARPGRGKTGGCRDSDRPHWLPKEPALAVALRTRNTMGRVFPGVIGSAHEVNLELDRVRWSAQTFGMDVEEMESGHVAAVGHAYGIRYIAFRVVSDAPYEGVPFYPEA